MNNQRDLSDESPQCAIPLGRWTESKTTQAVSSSMGGDLGISTDDRNRLTERVDVIRQHRSRIDYREARTKPDRVTLAGNELLNSNSGFNSDCGPLPVCICSTRESLSRFGVIIISDSYDRFGVARIKQGDLENAV